MNEMQYKQHELKMFMESKHSFHDGVEDFNKTLTINGREWMEEQLEWIENGSYGAGACLALERAWNGLTPRSNAKARIGQVFLHALYGRRFDHWNKLSPIVQRHINSVVHKWIIKKDKQFAITWEEKK